MEKDEEYPLDLIRLPSYRRDGEKRSVKCPHCGKDIAVDVRRMEGDPDIIEVWWGKNFDEIEDRKRGWEEEFGEDYEEEYDEEE